MNRDKKGTSNVGDDAYRETVSQMQELARDEDNACPSREEYSACARFISTNALEAVLESWERTFGATSESAVALTFTASSLNSPREVLLSKCSMTRASTR